MGAGVLRRLVEADAADLARRLALQNLTPRTTEPESSTSGVAGVAASNKVTLAITAAEAAESVPAPTELMAVTLKV